MYSASSKGCAKPGYQRQAPMYSSYPDSRLFQEGTIISPLVQNVSQWISHLLEVATSPTPGVEGRSKMAAHAQLTFFPPPPQPPASPQPHSTPPTQDQWGSQTVDPSDKGKGRGRQPGGGGRVGQHKSSRRSQSRERSHKQQKGGIPAEPTTLSHIVTDSERSLAE